jgi:hypothetical protein
MYIISNTRIVGLIAVVCAFVVAPQAFAASSTHSRIAPPGDEPSGFDVGELKNGRAVVTPVPGAVQGNDLSGFVLGDLKDRRVVLAPTSPRKSLTGGSSVAAIKALQRRSVDLDAAYRKLYPGAYRQALQASASAAVWSFPSCGHNAGAEYSYIYSGDPCKI